MKGGGGGAKPNGGQPVYYSVDYIYHCKNMRVVLTQLVAIKGSIKNNIRVVFDP